MESNTRFFKIANHFFKWFKPPEIEKPVGVIKMLEAVYPTIEWNKVKFYDGLPWFTSIFAPRTNAITLPGTYGFHTIVIHFKNFDPYSIKGMSTIVHEGFHVLQFSEIGTGRMGWYRKFMIQYLGWCIKLGKNCYANHPMEKQAYTFEAQFSEGYKAVGDSIFEEASTLSYNENALYELMETHPHLLKIESGYKPKSFSWSTVLASFSVLIMTLFLPLMDGVFLIITLIIFLVSALISPFIWTGHLIASLFKN